jgi:hypothetical protein
MWKFEEKKSIWGKNYNLHTAAAVEVVEKDFSHISEKINV